MNPSNSLYRRLRTQAIAALATALCFAPALRAVVLEFGDVKGHFDTTLSFGSMYRINDPSPDLYSISSSYNGVAGKQRSGNSDDGNLNYSSGIVSTLLKANHDLELSYHNAGMFVRGYYFTDFTNKNGQRQRTVLSDEAQRLVGEGGEVLDAYVYFKPMLGDMPARISIGRQVLSWGESSFIPNGINSVNPIDVAKLRAPGSELKEALLPLNMISGSLTLNDKMTIDAFYLLDWERTRVDPPGTYFSTNDFVAKGGQKVYLGFGAISDLSSLGAIVRGSDNTPGNSGQWGIAFRYLAERLNNTEFAVYYMNYHSRLPLISARTPTIPVNSAKVVSDSQAAIQGSTTLMTAIGTAAATSGLPTTTAFQLVLGAALGDPTATATVAAFPAVQALVPTIASQVTTPISTRELLTSAATGNYLIEFPEDIHLWGASFNTNIAGIALQGEMSYRDNQPLQIDDVELLFAALSPLSTRYGRNNQLGTYALNTYIPGYRRHKVWTGQMTATKATRGIFGADQTTLVAEAGYVNADIPNPGTLRYDGTGTFVGGDPIYMNASGSNSAGTQPLSEPSSAFASKFSWGYQLLARLDYNNAFQGVNVSPLVLFSHDVSGNTPLPLGNFREGRKTFTAGADFSFQNAWAFELRYVNFFGAGRYNLLADRDYVSATLKYSF